MKSVATLNQLPSSSLADKAMLVTLRRTTFNGQQTDKSATDLVANATNVKGKGRFRKKLFSESHRFHVLVEAYRALYEYHIGHTLPWEDRGARMLPSPAYFDFTAATRALARNCQNALEDFLHHYQHEVNYDAKILGPLFNATDYPRVEKMGECWSHKFIFQPIPAAGDFRIDVDPEVKEALEDAVQERIAAAQQHIVSQLLDPLQVAVERLSKQPGEAGGTFRDSLVSNIQDAAQRMAGLVGLSNDPMLARMVEKVNKLAQNLPAPAALRASIGARQTTAQSAEALVNDLVSMFGGGG